MRKLQAILLIVTVAGVVYPATHGLSLMPGIWYGYGKSESAPILNSEFRSDWNRGAFSLIAEYRAWKVEDFSFYAVNIGGSYMFKVPSEGDLRLFFAPAFGLGSSGYSHLPEYYIDESYDTYDVGGRFGASASFAEGSGLIELYFFYRGSILQGESDLDYLVNTRIALDGHVPLHKHFKLKFAIGGLSDNFYFSEGMGSYNDFGSGFLLVGPEIFF